MCPQTNKKLSFSRKIACSEFSACNVVSMFKRGLYTVKNYGLKRNCSVSIIYPERIQLLSVDVGVTGHFRQQEGEFGIRSKVKKKNPKTHGNVYSDNRTLRTADIKNNYNVWIVDKQRNVKSYLFLFIQCHNFIGADDFVEIAGGNGFELGFLNVRGRYCGMEANVGKKSLLYWRILWWRHIYIVQLKTCQMIEEKKRLVNKVYRKIVYHVNLSNNVILC